MKHTKDTVKMKVWDNKIPRIKRNDCTMRVCSDGRIIFSIGLSELLKVSQNKIVFLQDETRPQDWYIMPSESDSAFTIRRVTKYQQDTNVFVLQRCTLAKAILRSCKITTSTKFLVSDIPDDEGRYAIITKSAQ